MVAEIRPRLVSRNPHGFKLELEERLLRVAGIPIDAILRAKVLRLRHEGYPPISLLDISAG